MEYVVFDRAVQQHMYSLLDLCIYCASFRAEITWTSVSYLLYLQLQSYNPEKLYHFSLMIRTEKQHGTASEFLHHPSLRNTV